MGVIFLQAEKMRESSNVLFRYLHGQAIGGEVKTSLPDLVSCLSLDDDDVRDATAFLLLEGKLADVERLKGDMLLFKLT